MFFRKQRSEGVEGLDRIRESLRQQQQERRERGEVDDLLVTDPSELDEGVAVIKPVREPQSPEADDATEYNFQTEAPELTPYTELPNIEPTPFVETTEARVDETVVGEPVTVVEPPAPVAPPPAPTPYVPEEAAPVMAAPPVIAPPPSMGETAVERARRQETGRTSGNGESLIARNATWDGQLSSEGDVRIEGALQGSIEAQATVFIAQDARVNAKVRAKNVVIAGEFDGDIQCDEKLEVLPSGSIAGQVSAGTLVIHEGAFVDSRFAMNAESAVARNSR